MKSKITVLTTTHTLCGCLSLDHVNACDAENSGTLTRIYLHFAPGLIKKELIK